MHRPGMRTTRHARGGSGMQTRRRRCGAQPGKAAKLASGALLYSVGRICCVAAGRVAARGRRCGRLGRSPGNALPWIAAAIGGIEVMRTIQAGIRTASSVSMARRRASQRRGAPGRRGLQGSVLVRYARARVRDRHGARSMHCFMPHSSFAARVAGAALGFSLAVRRHARKWPVSCGAYV